MLRRGTAAAALAALVGLALGQGAASAQDPSFPVEEYSGLLFRPAPGAYDYIGVDGARVGDFALPPLQLVFDYSFHTLEIPTQCDARPELPCSVNPERAALVKNMVAFHLLGSWTVAERVELGLAIPFGYVEGEGLAYRGSTVIGGSSGFLGDPRLSGKIWILGDPRADRLALSTLVWLTLPLGQPTADGHYVGDDHPGFGGHVIGEAWVGDALRVAANLGGYYRPVRETIVTQVGPMLYYAVAGDYRFTDPMALVSVNGVAELAGSTLFANALRTDQLELRAAGRVGWESWFAQLGVGLGFILGPGVPDVRVLLGVGFAMEHEGDADGDGLLDRDDACPDRREDADGFADEDGCPELDNDNDGMPDARDRCKDQAEDVDEHEDEDGCPDLDNDGDSIEDGWDSCPETAEDRDGDRDADGCPESDVDGDGIDDAYDQCPRAREDTDGLGDDDGCPERDHDEDRVPDDRDECPEHPEDRDRFEDRDGCPEEGGRLNTPPP